MSASTPSRLAARDDALPVASAAGVTPTGVGSHAASTGLPPAPPLPGAGGVMGLALQLAERGWLPDPLLRQGIRRLLRARLDSLPTGNGEVTAAVTQAFVRQMAEAPLALVPHEANRQHYEVPAAFFQSVLGPAAKYSCCWWPEGVQTLAEAEQAALEVTAERAGLAPGQAILELGCGWGSLTLWMAARYPSSWIHAVSNSASQRQYILEQAARRGLTNVTVETADFNTFDTTTHFDRIVSVEMFEHLRNWPRAFARVARWLKADGVFFMHVFAHREAPYPFEVQDASDWMTAHFFAGGMMPSEDLALRCQDDLRLQAQWCWNGRHYGRTARAWLDNLDANRTRLQPLMAEVYGRDAQVWWQRWRLFFLSVEELFNWEAGERWRVAHYRFSRRNPR